MNAGGSPAHLVVHVPVDVQAMICAAAAAKQTYRPQRAAAKPKLPGPANRFQLLDDDIPDPEQHAAEGCRASPRLKTPAGRQRCSVVQVSAARLLLPELLPQLLHWALLPQCRSHTCHRNSSQRSLHQPRRKT